MPDYLLMLEPRLADVLEEHSLEEIAMLMYHNGIRSCQDLMIRRTRDYHDWQVFLGRIQLQYHILGRPGLHIIPRLMDAACEAAATQGPVRAEMVLPPPGTVVTEPTGQSQ